MWYIAKPLESCISNEVYNMKSDMKRIDVQKPMGIASSLLGGTRNDRFFQVIQHPIVVTIIGISSFGYACRSWFHIVTTSAPDFGVYYEAARTLLSHLPLYGKSIGFTAFSYPPQTALFFIPFTFLPYTTAQLLFVTISFLLIPCIAYLTLSVIDQKRTFASIILTSVFFFLFFPTRFTLGMGQINLVSLGLLLWAVKEGKEGREGRSGVLLALSILLKPQTMVLGIVFLLCRKWKIVFVLLGVIGGVSILFLSVFGSSYYTAYLTQELPRLIAFSGRDIYFNQSISSWIARLPFGERGAMVSFGVSIFLFFCGICTVIRNRYSIVQSVLLFLPFFLLFQPITWQHHLVYILPSILYVFTKIKVKIHMYILVISWLLLAINIRGVYTSMGLDILSTVIWSHGAVGLLMLILLEFISHNSPLSKE
jgi:alpha-1,2-mannosyltransferase